LKIYKEIIQLDPYDRQWHCVIPQLQHVLADELCQEVMELFSRHREDGSAGGHVGTAYRRQLAELAYYRHATRLLNDEYCFRIVFVS